MIQPDYLNAGDRIGIVSTARKISLNELQASIKLLKKWKLEVLIGNTIGVQLNQYAGSDIERIKDFQKMLDNPKVKAILCARGGYGTVRIIDELDFSRFIKNPKWIIGYSDITVLHSHIHANFGITTLHAIMPINLNDGTDMATSVDTLRKAIYGEQLTYKFDRHKLNKSGSGTGTLVGGNLSVLYSLIGSRSDIDTANKILFFEDLDEYLYHIDRMMMSLKRTGKLNNLAGLIVGGMTSMKDNEIPFGKTAEEIISEHVKEYNYPVCFGFPAGHPPSENRALFLGKEVYLKVGRNCEVNF